ncbi:flap structure-specific endonuclease [Faustovirus]|nr:flap structure-specific endonuclease [Faustovirus]AMN84525.1 flap structure-specific endonuclease [Faustovirus]AMP44333.1 Flap structure-specific endonuclease [Faustovirus]
MGVKGLGQFIEKHAKAAKSTVKLSALNSLGYTRCAIDALNVFFGWHTVGKSRGLTGADGGNVNHLQGVFFTTIKLLHNGIIPVYVFDGKAPTAKAATQAKRAEIAETNGFKLTGGEVAETKHLINLLGVEAVTAPGEADAYCAVLAATGKVDFVLTKDYDILTFGAPRIGVLDGEKITLVSLADILRLSELTHAQFITMCSVMGNDYAPNIAGVGAETAYKFVRKDMSLDAILDEREVMNPIARAMYHAAEDIYHLRHPEAMRATFVAAKDRLNVNVNAANAETRFDDIIAIMVSKGFNKERLEKSKSKFIGAMTRFAQAQ